jgi:hypothetical protein
LLPSAVSHRTPLDRLEGFPTRQIIWFSGVQPH